MSNVIGDLMQTQGKDPTTRIRHAMRQIRGAYIANVKAGRCAMDKRVLARYDATLEGIERATTARKPK